MNVLRRIQYLYWELHTKSILEFIRKIIPYLLVYMVEPIFLDQNQFKYHPTHTLSLCCEPGRVRVQIKVFVVVLTLRPLFDISIV